MRKKCLILFNLYYLPILALFYNHENASKNTRLHQVKTLCVALFTSYFRRRYNEPVVGVYGIILPSCNKLYDIWKLEAEILKHLSSG